MKNKTFARVLSFCLALILCFTWNIAQPIAAHALAIESGWLIYAIISFLAASGITFTAVGGVDALQSAVEEKWDDFTDAKKAEGKIIDIAPYIKYNPPSPSGGSNTPTFLIAAAAAGALYDFIEWLHDNGWGEGEHTTAERTFSVDTSIAALSTTAGRNTIFLASDSSNNLFIPDNLSRKFVEGPEIYGTVIPYPNSFNIVYPSADNITNIFYGATYFTYENTDYGLSLIGYKNSTFYSGLHIQQILEDNGYTLDDFYGITFIANKGTNLAYNHRCVDAVIMLKNGYISTHGTSILSKETSSTDYFLQSTEYTSTITVPETITEFEVDGSEALEIDFSLFAGHSGTFQTPEEFTEVLKQEIVETGTFPNIQTEIEPDFDSTPDSDPSDDPSTDTPPDSIVEEYPDVGELGLPDLGAAMLKKFPFSLPHTFGTILKIFSAERQTPRWEIEFPEPISASFTFDLSNFEELGTILRWSTTIGYCLGLILATRKFISW